MEIRCLIKLMMLFNFFLLPSLKSDEFRIVSQSNENSQKGYGDWYINTDGELLLMQQLLCRGDIVFDVGGNLGEWSEYALQTEPTINLFTFEPVPAAYERLLDLFASNPHIHVLNLGLSNKKGSSEFYFYNDTVQEWGLSGFYYREVLHGDHKEPEKIPVQHQTLDDFCAEHAIECIKLLKIDTEGSEWNILQGAKSLLKKHQICAIQFEYGGCYIDAKTTLKQVMQLLTENNYIIFRIFSGGLIHIQEWEDSLENYNLSNYCALRAEDCPHYELLNFE